MLGPFTRLVSVVSYVKDQWITQILWTMRRGFTANNATEKTLMFVPDLLDQLVQILSKGLRMKTARDVEVLF